MKRAVLTCAIWLMSIPSWAADDETIKEAAREAINQGLKGGSGAYYAIGAGIAIGLAAMGGGIGQGKVGSSAMDGIARNPQAQKDMFVPMIIGLALIESLVIYALVISFQLVGKI